MMSQKKKLLMYSRGYRTCLEKKLYLLFFVAV